MIRPGNWGWRQKIKKSERARQRENAGGYAGILGHTMPDTALPFWQTKTLEDMSPEEWELLCDGCGRCCLIKLEDEDTRELFFTRVICRYFDLAACRCKVYDQRTRLVPTCLMLDAQRIRQLTWIPRTCAYRRLAEGQGLAEWHPLVAGNSQAIRKAGISVRGKVILEDQISEEELTDYISDQFD